MRSMFKPLIVALSLMTVLVVGIWSSITPEHTKEIKDFLEPKTSAPAWVGVFTPTYTDRGYVQMEMHVPAEGCKEIIIMWDTEVGTNYLDDCLDWSTDERGLHDVPTHLESSEDGRTTLVLTHQGRSFPEGAWYATLKWVGGLKPMVKNVEFVK